MLLQGGLFIENIAKVICIEYLIHKEIVIHNKSVCLCELIERLDRIFEAKLMIPAHDPCVEGSVDVYQDVHADIVDIA